MVTRETLGKVIKTIREAKGLDQADICGGFDPSRVSHIESGGGYSHESIGQVVDALEMRMSLIYALAEHAGECDAPIDETVKLVLAIEGLPDGIRSHLQAVAVAFHELIPHPWDGVERRQKPEKE